MKRAILCLMILLLCFQIVSAIDTNVQIKTVPHMNVNVLVLSEDLEVYEKFNVDSDEYGDVLFMFSIDDPYFDMTIYVKDMIKDKGVVYEKLENQEAGEDIYVEVVPSDFEIIKTPEPEPEINLTEEVNITEEINETEEIQETSEKKSKISGKAILGKDSTLRRVLYYVGGIILLVVIVFFVIKIIKSKGSKNIKIKKLSDLKEERKEKLGDYREVIEDAEKKIKEAQAEINNLKNQDKIKEMEKRIEEEQRELKKLKGD